MLGAKKTKKNKIQSLSRSQHFPDERLQYWKNTYSRLYPSPQVSVQRK